METVLLVIHLIIALAMVGMILLQKSEGGAMGGGLTGGASVTGMATSSVRASPITRSTTILGMCFFASSLGLALLATPTDTPTSIFETAPVDSGAGAIPTVPVIPTVPSVPVDE